jgi:RNA recognition motif-containing protein
MNIYVGNLSFNATEEDLRRAFEQFGQVDSVNVIRDAYDGRSKGFGFVEMPRIPEAQTAMKELDGAEFMGRTLKVNPARPQQKRGQGRERRRNENNKW